MLRLAINDRATALIGEHDHHAIAVLAARDLHRAAIDVDDAGAVQAHTLGLIEGAVRRTAAEVAIADEVLLVAKRLTW